MKRKNRLSEAAAIMGRKGGRATGKNRTEEERIAAARHAAKARWKNYLYLP